MPETRMIFASIFFANSRASEVKSDVVMKIPFRARSPVGLQRIFEFRATDVSFPSLRLKVDHIKTEAVFVYNPVDAFVAALPMALPASLREPP